MTENEPPARRARSRHYSIAFRQDAVRLVEAGEAQRVVADRLVIGRLTLQAWLRRYGTAVYQQMKRKVFTAAQRHQIVRELHAGRVGRDYLFALLAGHGLLVRRHKRRVVTTQTCLPLFCRPNLIEHLTVSRAEQVWVSDITYVRLLSDWNYLSLITDLYSHKIVGPCLHPDLSVRGTLAALHQALAARTQPQRPLIHHSDRGLQNAAREYVGLLESHGVTLSMTQHGDPYENAVAERVNGILKDEFGLATRCPALRRPPRWWHGWYGSATSCARTAAATF